MPPDLLAQVDLERVGTPPPLAPAPTASGSRPAGAYSTGYWESRSASKKSTSPVPLVSRIGPRASRTSKEHYRSPPQRLFQTSPVRWVSNESPRPEKQTAPTFKGKGHYFSPSPPHLFPLKRSRRQSRTPPSSDDDSTIEDRHEDDVRIPVPGTQKPCLFAAPIDELVDSKASPLAQAIQQLVTVYKSDIDYHVDQFNCLPNKPSSWPTSLTKDLLEYKCIDLEKLWGEMESKPTSEIFFFDKKSKKMDVKGVTNPLEINDLSDFTQILEVLRHAYLAAFYLAAVPIKDYFSQISKLCRHQSKIHWTHVKNYDAEMRQEFSQRPSLAWGDYNAPELRVFKGRNLHVKYVAPTAAIPAAASLSYTQPRASSVKKAPSSKPKPAPKKTKRNFPPYEIKDPAGVAVHDQPCNNWNANVCKKSADECDYAHDVCNKLGCFGNHRGIFSHRRT
ncbi:uncharacterized protein MELLADRAFT_92029 [Melampsora larici-populina 98AG31]|uniref:C3H1-type domain-containing protein n=1 Tax=Melampsora larici-populina (strain 98AG31 / pathotype 3-4-7) TaxID=747676 RepID=F4S1A0_MELLP|nr:uncharacterized protein MELLADRAFT_92029 [Melampsora larici-populina 98AG31]EGG01528.1 hypothetical protein MELLADRAFT_92029 [Melampsora larici-populina 98AG31]